MQINQNQPNFKARVASVEPLIARHFADKPKIAQALRKEAEKLEKIGPDETTSHVIICDSLRPENLGVDTTITAPKYLKSIQSQLLPEQIAKKAQETYTRHMQLNPSAATIANA